MVGFKGGPEGPDPPFWGHDIGFLTLGPKLDPLLDPPCRPKIDPPPTPFKNPGPAPDFHTTSSLGHIPGKVERQFWLINE